MTRLTLLAALGATALGMLLASALLGSSELSMLQAFAALWGGGDETARIIVWEIRLPRALAALGVGMALGASGALMQGLLRNPLAEPGVLGVSASASLGAIIALYFGISVLGAFTVPVFAILGALAATGVLSGLASVRYQRGAADPGGGRLVQFRRRAGRFGDESGAEPVRLVRHGQLDAGFGHQSLIG